MIDITKLAWDKSQGLIPAVVQDKRDLSVLMLGYMNEAALTQTLETKKVTFFSRSKGRLWTKGESSGHSLELDSIRLDCDNDTLLVTAVPLGPTCHTGEATCFGPKAASLWFLEELDRVIDQRYQERPAGSYTTKLFEAGVHRQAQKVGEEGVEVALAAKDEDRAAFLCEAADLIFHLLVLLRGKDCRLADVLAVLEQRHKTVQAVN